MDNDNLMLTVAIVAVALSIVGFATTYNSLSSFQNHLTGFATQENGTINVSVAQTASINITHAEGVEGSKNINFSAGSISDPNFAYLYTNGTQRGSSGFAVPDEGFRIRNIGNQNVSLSVSLDQTADQFYDTGGGDLLYNLTSMATSGNSCASWQGGVENTYTSFATSPSLVCSNFLADDAAAEQDLLQMDIGLKIPSATVGDKGGVVILTYTGI